MPKPPFHPHNLQSPKEPGAPQRGQLSDFPLNLLFSPVSGVAEALVGSSAAFRLVGSDALLVDGESELGLAVAWGLLLSSPPFGGMATCCFVRRWALGKG
jgi:hypothetical protein